MAKLLLVAHRYAPYPGGTEHNTQRYAEAALALGNDVTVLAGTHKGDYNGVTVTSDVSVLQQVWDMIIVHGDAPYPHMQYLVNTNKQKSPVMYLLIMPYNSQSVYTGMENATWIGCATSFDIKFVTQHKMAHKIKIVNYGVNPPSVESLTPKSELITQFGLNPDKKIIMSCGGFWPNKGFNGLGNVFKMARSKNLQLVLTGYDWTGYGKTNEGEEVYQFYLENINTMYSFMAASDHFIFNSSSEGYGLVLLQASYYGIPWLSRPIGGAPDLANVGMGHLYNSETELLKWIRRLDEFPPRIIDATPQELQQYVIENYDPMLVTKNLLSVLD